MTSHQQLPSFYRKKYDDESRYSFVIIINTFVVTATLRHTRVLAIKVFINPGVKYHRARTPEGHKADQAFQI
jgi:hypothetical protein